MYCQNCGKKLSKISIFCQYCGSKINKAKTNKENVNYFNYVASSNKRLVNMFVDLFTSLVFIFVGAYFIGILLVFFDVNALSFLNNFESFISYGLWLVYYIVFEFYLNKTIGKYLSGTKVIMDDGSKPTIKAIFIRSICRLVPFEIFSFSGKTPIGWHDRWSHTLVIDEGKYLKDNTTV